VLFVLLQKSATGMTSHALDGDMTQQLRLMSVPIWINMHTEFFHFSCKKKKITTTTTTTTKKNKNNISATQTVPDKVVCPRPIVFTPWLTNEGAIASHVLVGLHPSWGTPRTAKQLHVSLTHSLGFLNERNLKAKGH
jgi:hypothetical protein